MRLRHAQFEDVDEMLSVKRSAWQAHYVGLVPDHVLTSPRSLSFWRSALQPMVRSDGKAGIVLLAEARGGIAGYAALDVDPTEDSAGQLKELYVRAELEGAGVGGLLLAHAIDHFRDGGKQRLALWVLEGNHHARRFYERRGLRPTGERRVVEIEAAVPELRYARNLSEIM
jgi:GNAT superfamily N-acetyltransferase